MGLYPYAPTRGYNCTMPKINVYLPDDLADAVRDTGVPVSAICQRALEQAVKRITAIRQSTALDLLSDAEDPAGRLRIFTGRVVKAIRLSVEHAQSASAANVGTGDLLSGMLAEGGNLALQILSSMEIKPASLVVPAAAEPGGGGEGLRFSNPAAAALELTVAEATAMGHNYVGCEHLLLGLAAEPDGVAGRVLRDAGADLKSARRVVVAALAGYTHLQAQAAPAVQTGALMTAVRQELRPLVERIERLESRVS
jgi:ATP-dependent Clp protease ATP-binding subunit ClpA